MKISLIIPAYNSEKFIHTCLESVKNQTYSDWECFIIDDCSSDNTANIVNQFINDNAEFAFTYVKNEKNLRQGPSRDKGVKLSTGEYFSFMDSDDILPPNSLEVLAKDLDDEDIIVGNYIAFAEIHGKKEILYTGAVDSKSFFIVREENFSNIYNMVYPWGKLYKRSFWLSKGFKYSSALFEDTILWVAVSCSASKVKVIDEVIYEYRVGNPHSESNIIVPKFKSYYRTLKERLDMLKNFGLLEKENYYVSFCLADAYSYINDMSFSFQRYKLYKLLTSYIPKLPSEKYLAPDIVPEYKVRKLKKMYKYGMTFFLKPKTNVLKRFIKKLW